MRNNLIPFVFAIAAAGAAYADPPMRFAADLEGFNLAGQPIATAAHGKARVEVIDDGTALRFRVDVKRIFNLLMAHIHVAPEPVEVTDPSGPVAYWFTGGPPPGSVVRARVNGRLAEGLIITDGDLEVWDPSDAAAGTVAGLIAAIREGRASVIVHTDDLDPNTPTGVQGDSRAGELRGTLR